MLFQKLFVQIASLLLVGQAVVHALPKGPSSLEERGDVPCDDISKYSVEVSLFSELRS
jgi:hypothetical protein